MSLRFPVLGRSQPHNFLEPGAKGADGREPDLKGDLGDALLGGFQKILRPVDPCREGVLSGRLTVGGAKESVEMVRRHARLFGELFQRGVTWVRQYCQPSYFDSREQVFPGRPLLCGHPRHCEGEATGSMLTAHWFQPRLLRCRLGLNLAEVEELANSLRNRFVAIGLPHHKRDAALVSALREPVVDSLTVHDVA